MDKTTKQNKADKRAKGGKGGLPGSLRYCRQKGTAHTMCAAVLQARLKSCNIPSSESRSQLLTTSLFTLYIAADSHSVSLRRWL